jgi:hypothetical protein
MTTGSASVGNAAGQPGCEAPAGAPGPRVAAQESSYQRQHGAPAQVVELTEAGKDFLRSAFRRADRDRDGALSAAEQDDMWSTAPAS